VSPVVAIVGKGGVGKTTVAALLARALSVCSARPPHGTTFGAGQRVLAVDADPAGGLAMALGLEPTRTLDDLRRELIAKVQDGADAADLLATADYRLMQALVERGPLALLVVGRPEEQGCYCKLNSFLRRAIEALSAQFAVTLVDAEAGVEQVNRRVMRSVSHLLLVSDLSRKGLRVAEAIHAVAAASAPGMQAGLVLNRVPLGISPATIRSALSTSDALGPLSRGGSPPRALALWGAIPEDAGVIQFDMDARPLFEMAEDSPAVQAVRALLPRLV